MTQHTQGEWKASHTAQRQSNYGTYKAGVFRGEGRTLEVITIKGDNEQSVLEIARNAAAAPRLLEALESIMAIDGVDKAVKTEKALSAIALATSKAGITA